MMQISRRQTPLRLTDPIGFWAPEVAESYDLWHLSIATANLSSPDSAVAAARKTTILQLFRPDCSSLVGFRAKDGGKLDPVGLVFDTSILAD